MRTGFQLKVVYHPLDVTKRATYIQDFKNAREMGQSLALFVRGAIKTGLRTSVCQRQFKIVRQLKENMRRSMHDRPMVHISHQGFRSNGENYVEQPAMFGMDRTDVKNVLIERLKRQRQAFKVNTDRLASGAWFRDYLQKRLKMPKVPTDDQAYIGIEIECIVPENVDYRPLENLAHKVSITGDGSINYDDGDGGEEGLEVRILTTQATAAETIDKVTAALAEMGARVNKSCGLHVHFDLRNTTENERSLIYTKLYYAQPLLFSVVPYSRRKNSYCSRNQQSVFAEAVHGERYHVVNATAWRKHQTIEIRLFNGTTDATKIKNWVALLSAIMAGPVNVGCPRKWETAQARWNLSDDLTAWCKARQAKFSGSILGDSDAPAEFAPMLDAPAPVPTTQVLTDGPFAGVTLLESNISVDPAGILQRREYTQILTRINQLRLDEIASAV